MKKKWKLQPEPPDFEGYEWNVVEDEDGRGVVVFRAHEGYDISDEILELIVADHNQSVDN